MIAFEPDLDEFSGVLSIRRGGTVLGEWATGLADRSSATPNSPDTRFALGSGSKTFTALTVLSLIDEGTLHRDTPVRSILGADLPLIADDVTIDHLLTHTSGIGDYLDEDVDALAPMTVPVQQLDSTPALFDGRIVSRATVSSAIEPVTADSGNGFGYGRGIRLDGDDVSLSGSDHGVSATSIHHPESQTTVTAHANIETRMVARTRTAMEAARRVS